MRVATDPSVDAGYARAVHGYGSRVQPEDRPPHEPPSDVEAARAVLEAPEAVQLLDSAAALAVAALPTCAFAGVVAPAGNRLTAIAASDSEALRFERLQTQIGEGPALDAALSGVVVPVDDFARETRWTAFVPRALAAGVRSVLSLPIGSDSGAVLSLYAEQPVAFGPDAEARARSFVTHVRLVLGALRMHEQDGALVDQLRAGLESRTVIGQAQGILMERERVTAHEAFAILRTASQYRNVKLREIAAQVVETGADPRALPPTVELDGRQPEPDKLRNRRATTLIDS